MLNLTITVNLPGYSGASVQKAMKVAAEYGSGPYNDIIVQGVRVGYANMPDKDKHTILVHVQCDAMPYEYGDDYYHRTFKSVSEWFAAVKTPLLGTGKKAHHVQITMDFYEGNLYIYADSENVHEALKGIPHVYYEMMEEERRADVVAQYDAKRKKWSTHFLSSGRQVFKDFAEI